MKQGNKVKPLALKAGKAAEYLGVSRRFLHNLTSAGRIPYHRISSRCFLYRIDDLDAFLASCRVGVESNS